MKIVYKLNYFPSDGEEGKTNFVDGGEYCSSDISGLPAFDATMGNYFGIHIPAVNPATTQETVHYPFHQDFENNQEMAGFVCEQVQ